MLHKLIVLFFALLAAFALASPVDSGYQMSEADSYDGVMPMVQMNGPLARMTRSNGKPTFIRFGKRSMFNQYE
ncbi:hypothetical protein PRIPAC_88339 [Pristionchus pacificus]|uniref:Uncharacterized protein n=1 Tax=Pristionchus pacificus TaxID=54126 RepID=A0A2A6BYU4_PRIPA|nr:hypothetical protein PRIPAC_88339 [Pristionchus pacificus]|eukprot:PDM71172.1 hypothetical protein PRIPAC_43555 [Pristionchus pacificus]